MTSHSHSYVKSHIDASLYKVLMITWALTVKSHCKLHGDLEKSVKIIISHTQTRGCNLQDMQGLQEPFSHSSI
jgi:hypothetical protein